MIIDDVGIHHGDWPLISINAYQDIKNSNRRDKNDANDVRVHVYKCMCFLDVDLGYLAIIAVGDLCPEVQYIHCISPLIRIRITNY